MTARILLVREERAVIDRAYRGRGKMKHVSITFLLAAFLLFGTTCPSAWAQATAQISGTVKDQSGAVLPGVEITATQTDTQIARMTVSNETGSFVLPNLPVGPYKF